MFIAGIGVLVLIGWLFNIAILKSLVPGWATMKSMSALLFVLSGVSLAAPLPRLARVSAGVVVLVSALTLSQYLFHVDLGIDQLLFTDHAAGSLYPGRMSPATALAFLLTGFSLLRMHKTVENWFDKFFILAVFTISLLALIGYLYEVSSLYKIGAYSSMALHTAATMLLLSLAILFARPERGLMSTILAETEGGYVLRRFLPMILTFPIAMGWIRLMGQRMELYDTAFGLALMVVSLIGTMTAFVWILARQLTVMDVERKQSGERLRASEMRFRNTLDHMIEGCQIIGYDWRYQYLNDTAVKHSRKTREQLLGRTMMECYPGIEESTLFTTLQYCMNTQLPARMINEFKYLDGTASWFDLSIQPTADGLFILSSDVTQRRQSEQILLEREMQLAKLLEILPVGISILGADRQISYTNPALQKMLQISQEGMRNGKHSDRHYIRADGTSMPMEEMASTRALQDNREIRDIETGIVKENGETIWTSVSAVPVELAQWKLVLVTLDITARKQAEDEILKLNAELEEKIAQRTLDLAKANQQLHELSIVDELTGLHNRRGFFLLAEEQFLLARRAKANALVFYADLDGLKQVNDQQGHDAGDKAIIDAAHALRGTFRSSDILARLGGDEFVVIVIEADEPSIPSLLARLEEMLTERNLSMSVGVVSFDSQTDTSLDNLIAHADQAMYEVKRNRSGRI